VRIRFKIDFGGFCALTEPNRNWTGAPRSPQRTPDFLSSLLALAHFMRLSLLKAAHAVVSGAAYRKSGSPVVFGPGTLWRTWGTRPVPTRFCWESDYCWEVFSRRQSSDLDQYGAQRRNVACKLRTIRSESVSGRWRERPVQIHGGALDANACGCGEVWGRGPATQLSHRQ
jgi:hypothetical protein